MFQVKLSIEGSLKAPRNNGHIDEAVVHHSKIQFRLQDIVCKFHSDSTSLGYIGYYCFEVLIKDLLLVVCFDFLKSPI